MAYLEDDLFRQDMVLEEVRDERARQEQLKRAGKFLWSCADNVVVLPVASNQAIPPHGHAHPVDGVRQRKHITHAERMTVLSEEVGEAAREVCDAMISGDKGDEEKQREHVKKLRNELVQVAAVAVAWIESIDKAGAP